MLGENDNVYAAQSLVLSTETFSGYPPDPITAHGGGDFLLGDGETDTRPLATTVTVKYGEIAIS